MALNDVARRLEYAGTYLEKARSGAAGMPHVGGSARMRSDVAETLEHARTHLDELLELPDQTDVPDAIMGYRTLVDRLVTDARSAIETPWGALRREPEMWQRPLLLPHGKSPMELRIEQVQATFNEGTSATMALVRERGAAADKLIRERTAEMEALMTARRSPAAQRAAAQASARDEAIRARDQIETTYSAVAGVRATVEGAAHDLQALGASGANDVAAYLRAEAPQSELGSALLRIADELELPGAPVERLQGELAALAGEVRSALDALKADHAMVTRNIKDFT